MKKMLKAVLIILLVLVVLIAAAVAGLILLNGQKHAHYYEHANSVGELETRYTAMGSAAVSRREYAAGSAAIGKFVVWYPTELASSDRSYPVVLWANGTGSKSETYKYFLTHLASWGFIAVGNDDENTRSGESLNAAIDLLSAENENPDSVFYHRIDLDNIGIGGHSQGGSAVFNMATRQPHADRVATVYAVSATSSYHTGIFGGDWEYDVAKISVPTFLSAGTGPFDAGSATRADQESDEEAGIMQGICPLWSLEENFRSLPDHIDKVYARKTGVDHGDSHLQFDGYMTAWFRYYLMDDEEAGRAFFGDSPELEGNAHYQDVRIKEGTE